MKNIILQRTIAVRCWNVIGMVAKASKRPELMPVLLRAREHGKTDAEDVAEHLFFEQRSRRVVAQRLLHIAVRYGLLTENERSFTLSEGGTAALRSDQVFVPEHGSWTIWTSTDPLLDYPILRIDPWREPTALDEVRGKDKENDEREFVDVPAMLSETVGRIAAPPGGDGALLRVDDFADKGEVVEPNAALRLEWNVTEGRMRLEGSIRGAPLNTVLDAKSIAPEAVWQQLLESAGLWSRWDHTRDALLVGFDETKESERESLLRDLAVADPSIADLGKFDAVTIQDVPLQVRTATDAGQWAAWRLQARLRDYATTERFDQWGKEATAPFAAFRLSVPSRTVLANEAWTQRGDRPSAVVWHLVAADDWSL